MAINFKQDEKVQRELIPIGNHVARLYSIVEIGHLPDVFNEGQSVHKIRLTWELPEEMREFNGEQKPMVIGGKYTVSLFEKANLRPIVEGMLGKLTEEDIENFDLKSLIGKPCMLQITHKKAKSGNDYATVSSAAQLPKSMKAPPQFNESQYLDYGEGWEDSVYAKLPQFVKDDMAASEEMRKRGGEQKSGISFAAKERDTIIDGLEDPF